MESKSAVQLYLELLKKTILFEIWLEYEAYLPASLHISKELEFEPVTVPLPLFIKQYAENHNLKIVKPNVSKSERHDGMDWPRAAHSMIGRERMNQLQEAMETVVRENIEGDFIETGVWRGGSCIFMNGFLQANNITDRNVWVADSFEGLPAPNLEQYPKDYGDYLHTFDYLRVSLEQVQENFKKYDLLNDQVKFLKGWFKDTLPTAPIEKIAIARLDGDMYESTMDGLVNLYDKVSKGGYIIIDDYGLPPCAEAVTDFRNRRNLKAPITKIDVFGVYWRKE
ncbi:TylF/MycF family methyltransferase [Bacillus cereus group sp. BC251]|jgi:O-methyltransferase|uniref:TylF/MycF family methyltransferase n=1 Tax=Bacillus TaxID=1386 RepID=UPI000C32F1D9|nr:MULTISPECIES: TylF/MycF family methyltransferase [Bacillus cereus group]AUD24762.1 macrocin O-methyltransferase [Bacillus sp. HBCD-sjtu]KAA2402434.1 macrocin O-methyltransferase [Bacillus cereus]MDA1812128.1 TylF/MycF family methyltransferase [Bacillus cereus]HDR4390603.1 TylF/MycF family methyltransferase [Bacillus cereus]HDR4599220.1 TylF/MycF family methyltransferase [Bacillus cereus]